MPVQYMNKRSPYEVPSARSSLKGSITKTRSLSNSRGSSCHSDITSSISRGDSSGGTSSASSADSGFTKRTNVMKSPRLLTLQLERLQKNKPWDHIGEDDVRLFTRSSNSAPKAVSSKGDGRSSPDRRPSTVPIVRRDSKIVKIITLTKLQGGGQVKWKPTEKKRPHHPSTIQLPAVYETWKEPSRINRRRTQAAAAAAAEARRSSRSVPSLSRRDRTESPERVSNSAPSSKPRPSNHDRHNSEGASSKKNHTPPRLPKINTLISGGPESNSSSESPSLKTKHGVPKDGGKKITSPPPIKNHPSPPLTEKPILPLSPRMKRTIDAAAQSKGDRLKGHVEEDNNPATNSVKEVAKSKKLPSAVVPPNGKKENVGIAHRDAPSEISKEANAIGTERKKEEKHVKGISKSTSKETNNDYQRTKTTLEESRFNASDQNVSNKLPKRTSERSTPEKKNEIGNIKLLSESRGDKTPPKSNEDRKTRTFTKAHTQPTFSKQRPNDVKIPTKAPPSRLTNSRVGTTSSSRVNPRSKSDLVRVKPTIKRRQTKTGFFSSNGDFVTNDEDGKQSDISAATTRTKRTEGTMTTGRSNISGSTTSTKMTTSSKSSINSQTSNKPLKKHPTIITKKTLSRQKFYNSVYNNQHFKIQRQTAFLKKVENAQLKIDDEKTRANRNSQQKRHESVVRQYQSLKNIRDKFDEEQVKRFSRQYVSWRSVEEDRLKRQSTVYGLPDNIYEDRYDKTLKEVPKVKKSKSKSDLKKKDKKFSRFARWVRNINRFEKILKPNMGAGLEESMLRSTHGALVEGRDIVELHQSHDDVTAGRGGAGQGPSKTKKIVKVRNVIGSAKRLLQATQDMDAISEVSDEDDADDDSDDYSDISSLDLSDDEE